MAGSRRNWLFLFLPLIPLAVYVGRQQWIRGQVQEHLAVLESRDYSTIEFYSSLSAPPESVEGKAFTKLLRTDEGRWRFLVFCLEWSGSHGLHVMRRDAERGPFAFWYHGSYMSYARYPEGDLSYGDISLGFIMNRDEDAKLLHARLPSMLGADFEKNGYRFRLMTRPVGLVVLGEAYGKFTAIPPPSIKPLPYVWVVNYDPVLDPYAEEFLREVLPAEE